MTTEKTIGTTFKKNGESWGRYFAKWALGLLATLIGVAIVAGAGSSIQTQKDLVEIKFDVDHSKDQMIELNTKIDNLQIPPRWLEDKVERIDQNLIEHIRTTTEGRGGGGGS